MIKDNRTDLVTTKNKLKRLIKSINYISKVLLKLQTKIESKIFKAEVTIDNEEIIRFLNRIECIELCPKRNDSVDIFNKDDSEHVKKYDLDIILQHEFNTFQGDILKRSKLAPHGVRAV